MTNLQTKTITAKFSIESFCKIKQETEFIVTATVTYLCDDDTSDVTDQIDSIEIERMAFRHTICARPYSLPISTTAWTQMPTEKLDGTMIELAEESVKQAIYAIEQFGYAPLQYPAMPGQTIQIFEPKQNIAA